MPRGDKPSRRAVDRIDQELSGGKRAYRGKAHSRRIVRQCAGCSRTISQVTGSYLGDWCKDCSSLVWRSVYDRDGGSGSIPPNLMRYIEGSK
jgi:hypothetical protein